MGSLHGLGRDTISGMKIRPGSCEASKRNRGTDPWINSKRRKNYECSGKGKMDSPEDLQAQQKEIESGQKSKRKSIIEDTKLQRSHRLRDTRSYGDL